MTSLLGQSLVLISLGAAVFGAVVGFAAGKKQSLRGLSLTRQATWLFGAAMLLANVLMIIALVRHDFSVKYVAQVGSRATPLHITIVSLWSALEGSILLWGVVLGVYACVFAHVQRHRHGPLISYALATVLAIGAFFALLVAGPADPFAPVSPVPEDGPGPNPLLQNHPLMIIHPPMLYLGYVGMTIPFAIAIASLLAAQMPEGWLKLLRRSTMVAWTFLTFGIILGGWWAYEVLGWGGYWAWDPVENASFLPWLAATGYLHSTVVQERRRMLKVWTLSLVIASFLLTVLGTFMTRSGVFNSVHSFTQSPIGPLFLIFLAVLTVISIVLLSGRAHLLRDEEPLGAALSRETAFLVNNALFVLFTFTVLLGTVFPIITEAVRGVQVSVGEPYFNKMAVPLGLLLVFLMGVGPALPWGKPEPRRLVLELAMPAGVGALAALGLFAAGLREGLALATFGLCAFAAAVTFRELLRPVLERKSRRRGEGLLQTVSGAVAGRRRSMGGYVVHLAVIVIVAAICGSQLYKQTIELSLTKGQSAQLGPYTLTFAGTRAVEEAHRFRVAANIEVRRDGELVRSLEPALNFYPTQREPVGSPHVSRAGHGDIYLSLLSVERDGSRVGLKAFLIPLVPYIWWMLPVLGLGSAVALWPRRRTTRAAPSGAEAAVR